MSRGRGTAVFRIDDGKDILVDLNDASTAILALDRVVKADPDLAAQLGEVALLVDGLAVGLTELLKEITTLPDRRAKTIANFVNGEVSKFCLAVITQELDVLLRKAFDAIGRGAEARIAARSFLGDLLQAPGLVSRTMEVFWGLNGSIPNAPLLTRQRRAAWIFSSNATKLVLDHHRDVGSAHASAAAIGSLIGCKARIGEALRRQTMEMRGFFKFFPDNKFNPILRVHIHDAVDACNRLSLWSRATPSRSRRRRPTD